MSLRRGLPDWVVQAGRLARQRFSLPDKTPPESSLSLVHRIQWLLLCWGAVVYGVAAVFFWFVTAGSVMGVLDWQAEQWVEQVDEMSWPLFVEGNDADFSLIGSYAYTRTELVYIRLYPADGSNPVYEYVAGVRSSQLPSFDSGVFAGLLQKYPEHEYLLKGEVGSEPTLLRLQAPVYNRVPEMAGHIAGYIDMGVDTSTYRHYLLESVAKGAALVGLLFLLVAVLGGYLAARIIKPLLVLVESSEPLPLVEKSGEVVTFDKARGAIKQCDEELRRLAEYDSLTGLLNKRSLYVLLENELRRVQEEADCSALFLIDLDQFKTVNDALGYASGDRLLIRVAELLKKHMQDGAVVCRPGGDEFAVLVRSVCRDKAAELAASVVELIGNFVFIEQGRTFKICCSVGVMMIESGKNNVDDVFSNADMACYSAKLQGRNGVQFYEAELVDGSNMDIGWYHRITSALANDRFELHYQPIISVKGMPMKSYEVLLRMKGDKGELVAPGLFIPIAERFGLATEIDYWVIKNSMKMLEKMNLSGRKVRFYVNLSGQLLLDPDFVGRVINLFRSVAIQAEQIVFELTERAAIGDIYNASKKMDRLKAHGFEFAVDDFGSGFSSFSYLKYMPVEYVKIEGEFIERILDDEVARTMVKSMVDIAKACGKKVVAEYVCDQKTFDLLKTYGIDYVQGYFIAEPSLSPFDNDMESVLLDNVPVLKVR